ncbi:hypothetical protein MOC99_19185 [Bacillus haynesii]|uniref:hypothetical protein n=1 Tax=Bacillus haynesii TaxID=1925021 RepID=UPI00227E9186|nr:hypothetical protein [Bacillus haynesii]MCY7771656.1 hypothetical protein [Bacillus haynesii]MCY7999703.1 hypothetical protein [Bacillus haynesii]MCY8012222.1 hypothetical protein [Bacillus haynesii]MCY8346802.1 hypothetical protein [Bacillus haynesii]MCY8351929.1 hypothetical protein [Bacillus haynesii]
MKEKFPKILFVLGWIVIVAGIFSNIESTLYYNANQYVPAGGSPESVRVMQIVSDIVDPLYRGGILISLSYLLSYVKGFGKSK